MRGLTEGPRPRRNARSSEERTDRRAHDFNAALNEIVGLNHDQFRLAMERLPQFRDPGLNATVRHALGEIHSAYHRAKTREQHPQEPLDQTVQRIENRKRYYEEQALYRGTFDGEDLVDEIADRIG